MILPGLPKEMLVGKLSGKFISLPQHFFFKIAIITHTYSIMLAFSFMVAMDTQREAEL